MLKEIFLRKLNIKSKTVNNAIITLGDTDDTGKGKKFKSRFIQPGLAGYPGQHGNVLVKKETLDKSLNTIIGAPVIINHKNITEENVNDFRVGVISNAWFNEKDGWYWCDGVIWDETAINLIQDKKWSVSCSYDYLGVDDEGGSENNIPYDKEFTKLNFVHLALVDNPRYERANIVFNSKTVVQNFNPNHDEKGRFCEGQNKYAKDGKIYENFIDIHKDLSEKSPPHWEGETIDEALEYLGIKDKQSVKIKSPVEDVTIYKSHMEHLIEDNNAYRKKYLNRAIRTIQAPNLILKTGDYNNYLKVFTDQNDKIKPHLQIVKTKGDGNFYVTTMKPTKQQVKKFILEGQAIYDLSSMSSTKSTDTNIIPNSINNLKSKHEEMLSKIHNAKEHEMALLEELKKLITKVENDKGEEMDDDKKEKVDNEKVDKRKLIDEVGGILKDKISEEDWRTVIGKIEKLGYNESEAGTSDNKKVKNESEEDKQKVEELKKEVKEDVENKKKCDNSVENAKTDFFNKMNEVYNASTSIKEENVYVSRESKLQAAKDYFSK